MAHCRAVLPVDPTLEGINCLLSEVIAQLGLEISEPLQEHPWLIATDRPQRGLKAREYVRVLCDWSNLRNTGEMAIETRSGESMAHSDTRAKSLLQQLCSRLEQVGAGR
ncbi:MAG: hypothetical protein FJ078_07210 [Cyanobacteria bacterium K_DeepCast_35m_m2_155]|nr:hypothetical protein [Cyanobacteria bacterium K_DeepCast_35m_m2_155]